MNLFRACRRLAAQSSEKPKRDREFDGVVIAITSILLIVAFWMHVQSLREDSQASNQLLREDSVTGDISHLGTEGIAAVHRPSP